MNGRHKILIVDDEPDILDSLALSLDMDYNVLTAEGGVEGLALLEAHEIALIISDQRMPTMMGVEFLERSEKIAPQAIRIMLTGFSDFDAIVEAINKGKIHQYISKPWEPRQLEMDIRRAIEHYEIQVDLKRRMDELEALCEIGRTITSELDPERVIQKVLDGVVDTLGFDRSFLMQVDHEAGVLRGCGASGVAAEDREFVLRLQYDLTQYDIAPVVTVKENLPILVKNVDAGPISLDKALVQHLGIRSFVSVPLQVGEQGIGVLVAGRENPEEQVTEHDQRLLVGFADQAAIALENARLYGEALEKQRLEKEAAVAGRIQKYLLPEELPDISGFQIARVSRPSRWVSGDYYDVVADGKDRIWIAVGDVVGKGMQAALTMATLRALFLSEVEHEASLPAMMTRISQGLFRATAPEVFATFCFGVIDSDRGLFRFVNAGHPLPILARSDGTVIELEGAGFPAGMDPVLWAGTEYLEQQVSLSAGDVLALFSDGVTEAGVGNSEDCELFGEDRLMDAIQEARPRGAEAVKDAVCAAVDRFAGTPSSDDDLTLVVVEAL
ncbi:MAG: SpoIIE family protein phosphatase [bacterium]|nr:SpoIIE family protein phosphatase [bacterium]